MRRALRHSFTVLVMLLLGQVPGWAQTNYNTSPPAQTGEQIYGSYFNSDIDTIGLYNGNLSLSIGLFSLPGRELPYGLTFTYNSQKWEQDTCSGQPCSRYTGGWRKATVFGSSPSFFATYLSCDWVASQSAYRPKYQMNVYWIDGGGAKHRYKMDEYGMSQNYSNCPDAQPPSWDSRTLDSLDSDGSKFSTGQYMSFGATAAKIDYKNGYTMYFRDHGATSPSYDYATPNGNYFIKGASDMPTQDTLGRSMTVTCSLPPGYCNPGATYSEYHGITDSNGVSQTYTVNYAGVSAYNPYSQVNENIPIITSIGLPNGKSYAFEYNHTQGFLTKLTLPSGAYIKYVYSTPQTSSNYDQVIERRVSADGTVGSEKVWSYSGYAGLGTTSSARNVTVTNPEADNVVHYFNAQGQETATEWRTSTNTVLKKTIPSWSQIQVESNNQANNPRVNSVATYMNGSLLSTKTVTYDANLNPTEEKLYDAGGTLVTQKTMAYTNCGTGRYEKGSEGYWAINPVNGGLQNYFGIYYYFDEYPLTARSGVPNHNGNTSQALRCNVTSIHRTDGANTRIDHLKYDSVGNVVEKIDPLNHSTLIDFTDNFTDSVNRNTFAYPKRVTNALSQYSTTKYDFNTGLPKVITNLRGYNTSTVYDSMNRITSITEPNNKVTTYAYDDTNRITTKEVTVDASGNKGRVKTYFDGLYRVTQTRTNDPAGEIAVDATYDGNGRKKQVSNPYRIGSESPVWTTTTYDALSRTTQIQAPDGSTVQYGYTATQTTTTDQAGNTRRYTYNILGQMTMVEEPNPTLDTPLVTTYSYNMSGPLYRSNQGGQIRTFVHNAFGDMTSQTLPESGTTTFTYDNAARLLTKTDARSITTTNTYDIVNRLTQKSYSDGTPTVTLGYDASGQTGLKTSMTDGLGSVSYSYDLMDRLTTETRTLTGVTGTFSTGYSYNIKGDVTSMTYPSGRVVNFNYATGGGCCNSRLSSVVDQTTGVTLANSLTYNAAGETLTRTLNPGTNAVVESFTYNNRLQLTQIKATKGATDLMDFTYNYGTSSTNTGRVLSRTDAIQPEHSAQYVYDSIYRLSQVVGSSDTWGIAWGFDIWGNRLTQSPQGLASGKVGSQTRGYSNNRDTGNTYDSAGNQTNDGSHTYGFDAENRIKTMDVTAAAYGYDGEGRRMKKTVGSETTYTFYGLPGILCEFTTTNTGATAAASTDKPLYRTSDKVGTVVLLIAANGAATENNRTLPYGELWLAEIASTNKNKFTTYERDAESLLDYAMARYYGYGVGRFQSTDSAPLRLQTPTSLNRYLYTLADPINNVDPTGLEPDCPYSACVTTPPPKPTGLIEWVVVTARQLSGRQGYGRPVITVAQLDEIRRTAEPSCGSVWGPCISDTERDVLETILNDPEYLDTGVMPFMPGLNGAGGLLNKLNHIFGNPGHNLANVVQELGGRLKAYEAIANATVQAIEKLGLKDGRFQRIAVKVGSEIVTVTGTIINGVVNIGTASGPPIP